MAKKKADKHARMLVFIDHLVKRRGAQFGFPCCLVTPKMIANRKDGIQGKIINKEFIFLPQKTLKELIPHGCVDTAKNGIFIRRSVHLPPEQFDGLVVLIKAGTRASQ